MKNLIEWCENKNLHIIELDKQHQNIANIINKLYHFLQLPQGADNDLEIREFMAELIKQIELHFQLEEQYMEASGYQELKYHRQEHMLLKAELKDYSRKVINGKLKLNKKVLNALRNCLISHIMCSDMDFAKHYHQQTSDKKIQKF